MSTNNSGTESFLRAAFEALLPPGAIWTAEYGAGLDQLISGIVGNNVDIKLFLDKLASLREPEKTEILGSLEREFGAIPAYGATESQRRNNLETAKTRRGSLKNAEYLEFILRDAGFDVYVHINDPPVDPDQFLFEAFSMFLGEESATFGEPTAVFGGIGGYLAVNGELVRETSVISFVFGSDDFVFGGWDAYFGERYAVDSEPVVYTIPADPGYWGLFFFVGGAATRNPSGELIDIEAAEVEVFRRPEFERIILQLKPMHSWAGLIVQYVAE